MLSTDQQKFPATRALHLAWQRREAPFPSVTLQWEFLDLLKYFYLRTEQSLVAPVYQADQADDAEEQANWSHGINSGGEKNMIMSNTVMDRWPACSTVILQSSFSQ